MPTKPIFATISCLLCTCLWPTCVIAVQTPSLFQERPPLKRETKICINIGSKDETIGPYQPETPSIYVPAGIAPVKEIWNIKKRFPHRRAFQLVRTLQNNISFVIQAEPWYRYNIELGFIDVGKNCKNGGSKMEISVGDQQTKYGLNPTKTAGCSSPFYEKFFGVSSDAWNRIIMTFRGDKLSNFATICVEKESSSFPVLKGVLHVAADYREEVFLNGISVLKSVGCSHFNSTEIMLKYDDLIAVEAFNEIGHAALRVQFLANGKNVLSTDDDGWKVRNAFPVTGDPLTWTRSEYIDSDWPSAENSNTSCYRRSFLQDVKSIWSNSGQLPGKVFFRYRVKL